MSAARVHRRTTVVRAGVAGMIVAALIAVLHASLGSSVQRAAPMSGGASYGTAPAYTLTDQHGRPFGSAALRGKIQVVSFLFPYCTNYCPLTARTLADTERLADQSGLGDRVAFVAFNVDPAGAGPADLTAFLTQEGIDPLDPRWHYLTGSQDQIRQVVTGGFHVFYQKVSSSPEQRAEADQQAAGAFSPQPTQPNPLADRAQVDYDIVHNDVIEIVDATGVVRAILSEASAVTAEQIVTAIQNIDTGR